MSHESSTELGTRTPSQPLTSSTRTVAGKANDPHQPNLLTGRCMTCASMVRWPKDLSVFRCTVCLTINDLAPISTFEASHAPADGRLDEEKQLVDEAVSAISTQKTLRLIDSCINSYLLSRLGQQSFREAQDIRKPVNSSSTNARKTKSEASRGHAAAFEDSYSTSDVASVPTLNGQEEADRSRHAKGRAMARELPMGPLRESSYSEGKRPCIPGPAPDTSIPPFKAIFRPLEDYIVDCFNSHRRVNDSFVSARLPPTSRAPTETHGAMSTLSERSIYSPLDLLSTMDEKTLLLGDFAENGTWWAGGRVVPKNPHRSHLHKGTLRHEHYGDHSTRRPSRLDWSEAKKWYHLVTGPGADWEERLYKLSISLGFDEIPLAEQQRRDIGDQILQAQKHTQRVLLKVTESLLKRPGGPLQHPDHIRFILIILANPLLYPSQSSPIDTLTAPSSSSPPEMSGYAVSKSVEVGLHARLTECAHGPGKHSGIVKRILGLLSNLPNDTHHYLVSWFSKFSVQHFKQMIELVGTFVTYRLSRQNGRQHEADIDLTGDLVPDMPTTGNGGSAALHAALGAAGRRKTSTRSRKLAVYNDDWQIKAAARVMALLFAANSINMQRKEELPQGHSPLSSSSHRQSCPRSQIVPISDFYNTLLDYSDLISDFEAWESKKAKFTFCQYPFFLSIWAKIKIMEHDARRQMEVKAREAFFNSIITRKQVNQYLILKIRRDCLVEDSLKGVSEVVGSGTEEIKKGLRIEFKNEEGIDAGGLRKEWFLLLVRDVFNPNHGMFVYDDDSRVCFFNPHSFETSDQFFLVGVVLGLAIYNSTILDVALPSFAFRKLLAAGPAAQSSGPSHAKVTMVYTLQDLAEYRPALARGLKQLLDFEGNVEETFCRNFVADVDRYGQMYQVPLCTDGENKAVTNTNRREFVELYIRYLLDTAVAKQFEPFKRGFYTVCGGNALSLFRAEEIELLVRGSDDPLDIDSLRAVAMYENWDTVRPADSEPVIRWFWQSFAKATPTDQRKLLSFITASDRIPAMGATSLVIKISCLGNDCPRYPVARTCFNMISLWRYSSKEKLEAMLWRAVYESEGFGLK